MSLWCARMTLVVHNILGCLFDHNIILVELELEFRTWLLWLVQSNHTYFKHFIRSTIDHQLTTVTVH